jgi:hypothetical protein
MYILTSDGLGHVTSLRGWPSLGVPPSPTSRVLTYSTKDVIDKRISVPAQHSLVRLSKNPATSAEAVGMLQDVKAGRLAGVYCVNWQKPAQRALRFGKSWWTVIPPTEDAVLMLDPDNPLSGQPLIAFRRELDLDCGLLKGEKRFAASPSRLDAALLKAWSTYRLWQMGKLAHCSQVPGVPVRNVTPAILCQAIGRLTEPHGCPVPPRHISAEIQALQVSGKPAGCISRGEVCSTRINPILCLYADVDESEDPDAAALFRGMADRWACIAGAPNTFWFPALGGTPFRTGKDIIQAMEDAASFANEKLKEVHVFGHMVSEGGCIRTVCTPIVGTGIRGRDRKWTGLYLDRISKTNRTGGGRTISDIPFTPLADSVVVVLHGCNSAAGKDNFAQALFQHLHRRLGSAIVYGHPTSACAGQENCWVEYRNGNPVGGKRLSRISNYSGGHRCCKPAARCAGGAAAGTLHGVAGIPGADWADWCSPCILGWRICRAAGLIAPEPPKCIGLYGSWYRCRC